MATSEIFIVEDDVTMRQLLATVLGKAGYDVTCFVDGDSLLAATGERYPLCIMLDICLPGQSGLDILKRLTDSHYPAPVFMISGHGTIDVAVQAIKDGATDFIQKPFRANELAPRIEAAIARDRMKRVSKLGSISLNFPGHATLTAREREILAQTMLGKSTKQLSRLYGISPRTVEDHRSNIRRKTGGKSFIELIRDAIGSRAFENMVMATTQVAIDKSSE
ncbi:response regulator transcription factor [Bradyrhizobium sp.]|uniref:response regulator transcription factor n=1 Tax=Bradyrhizobium sp. TaxID=376 RepID=UPI003C699E13